VPGFDTDDANDALAPDDLAVAAKLLHRCANFHCPDSKSMETLKNSIPGTFSVRRIALHARDALPASMAYAFNAGRGILPRSGSAG
jgi:hypothetical protein